VQQKQKFTKELGGLPRWWKRYLKGHRTWPRIRWWIS